MTTRALAAGMMLLLQTTVGVLGNLALLYHYLFHYFTGYRLRPTYLIVNNLMVANTLVLLSGGIQFTISCFVWTHHLSDFGCKIFPYSYAVGRGVSIGTTCLLSIIQAITISPMKFRWAGLKVKISKHIVPTIFLYWILQMSVNAVFPMFIFSNLSNKNITNTKHFGFCSAVRHDKTRDSLYAALLTFPDVVCLLLMLWASSSMVFILHRHKQRVQHIHRTHITSQFSPESRATKTILLLVSTFVFLNTLSSIFHIILSIFNNLNWVILNISSLLSLCFPTVSPFLVMSGDSNVSRLSFAWIRNAKFSYLRRNT
ncbi:vomeronasal type-1 receptor 4-like [Phyllostomus discolor]|uniref:Vomeronasal type-1 receptor n=1 Tax=Phyllostomus discolor TaxID=89673 RepID=A0A6J2N438_9CHIR|nr:vomeronasal type-1 receptor 4-like [Phyllostomus discolor]